MFFPFDVCMAVAKAGSVENRPFWNADGSLVSFGAVSVLGRTPLSLTKVLVKMNFLASPLPVIFFNCVILFYYYS